MDIPSICCLQCRLFWGPSPFTRLDRAHDIIHFGSGTDPLIFLWSSQVTSVIVLSIVLYVAARLRSNALVSVQVSDAKVTLLTR